MRRGRWARRGERSSSMDNTMPPQGLPVVVPETSLGPTTDGVRRPRRPPQGGRLWSGTPGRAPYGP
ncbi:hypothetical protein DVZ84_26590 [Streptomyces parvulus]|uniref:Uncharacterized protein n=1 Tax=Streptomyces parvulus TaxID=146923 RepID=A0A369UZA0_9ACTN|nr:hypothetical protein DVZ84_26590 [Streptomyces parvulus]